MLGGCRCSGKAPDPSGAAFDLGLRSLVLEQPAQVQRCERFVSESKRVNQAFDLLYKKYDRWAVFGLCPAPTFRNSNYSEDVRQLPFKNKSYHTNYCDEEMQFWAAHLPVNVGPLVPPRLALLGVLGDGVLGKVLRGEMVLLLGLVKIGGADAQRDRCSELHTGESHQAAVPGLHPSLYLGR
ncbi:hypothetical protein EYF80_003291 [Liparis tanakae]|uniref:Uncharacterized protein n=1 Tax=Liparis tanakae TaxID=230148 RepID=A0A4Z2J9C1_9TELE|nr:hypothetical protein EYF80_003291 [Liparis tanakae]